jgi:hypothetical protein
MKKKEKKINLNKGFITNSILNIYKQKEDYSQIQTHVPSESVPSYRILLELISKYDNVVTLKGFKLLKKYSHLQFYQNIENPKIILVGICDTNFSSIYDVCTIGIKTAILRGSVTKLKRYNNDVKNIIEFQKKYPVTDYYYIGTGLSVAGSISDLFLENGYLHEAVTFNSLVESKFMNRSDIKNYRIYVDEDICYLSCGQYACNTKVYVMNPLKKTFINPINEYYYLYKMHTFKYTRSLSLSYFKKKLLKEEKIKKQHNVDA